MSYKIKNKPTKPKKKQSYIWDIVYTSFDKTDPRNYGHNLSYSQQSVSKEKAIKIFKRQNPDGKLLSIKLDEDTPTPEDVRSLERAYIRGARAGMKF